MLFNKKAKFFFLFLFLFLFLGTNFAYALEIDYPSLPGIGSPQNFIKRALPEEIPGLYIKYIIYLIIWTSIILVGVVLVIGGTRYIFSAASAQGKASARDQISSAFLGLLILFTSVLILETINPQITAFKLPTLSQIFVPKRTDISPPPSEKPRTLINVELPLGTIIEKRIFETQTPQGKESRMQRISNTASNTLTIAEKLKSQSETLEALILSGCLCGNTRPDGNYCTCDPCSEENSQEPRTQIQDLQAENLKLMGIEIKEDSQGETNLILPGQPNLISEQKKTVKEVRLLKQEVGKLIRAKTFMTKCPSQILGSLADYQFSKDFYEANKWTLIQIRFWREILIDTDDDHATFYCPVSGTILAEFPDIDIPFEELGPSDEIIEPPGQLELSDCEEIPVGKFIDKSKRLGNKLVERLEKLIDLNEQMVKAIDQLHILISQCSSQNCVYSPGGGGDPTGEEQCTGNPCPNGEIINQVKKIQYIFEEIETVVKAPIPQTLKNRLTEKERENIGIIPIIEKVIPGLIKDLNEKIKKPMKECITDIPSTGDEEFEQPSIIFSNCENVVMSLSAGTTIQACHLQLRGDILKAFNKCLSQCYLEIKYESKKEKENTYKKCFDECLVKEARLNKAEVKAIYHSLDFFCCGK